MIAVIFEVVPVEDGMSEYLDIAAILRDKVSKIDGFISIERFQCLSDPDKYLSLSFWQHEDAIKQWREDSEHRAAQQKGKHALFANYQIHIAHVTRSYGN